MRGEESVYRQEAEGCVAQLRGHRIGIGPRTAPRRKDHRLSENFLASGVQCKPEQGENEITCEPRPRSRAPRSGCKKSSGRVGIVAVCSRS